MDELIDIVDENDNVIGVKLKSEAHRDGSRHRSAHVWIVKDGKIFMQRRGKNKRFFPNKFDVACAGHLMSGESYEEGAIRELKEEVGLDIEKDRLIPLQKRKQTSIVKDENGSKYISREIMMVFLLELKNDEKMEIDKNEIEELKAFEIQELKDLLENRPELFVDDKKYLKDIVNLLEKNMSPN